MDDFLIGDDGELILPQVEAISTNIAPIADLFLADPDNQVMITGRISNQARFEQIITIIGFCIALFVFTVLRVDTTIIYITFFLFAGVVICFVLDLELAKHKLLREKGKLIGGEIVYYKKQMLGLDEVYYRFVTPSGRELIMKARVARRKPILQSNFQNWGKRTSKPKVGMPVAVLYLDDDNFKLL